MENKKIFGNLVGVPTPKTDWNQTDETKADYVVGSKEYRSEVDSKFANALKGSASGVAVRADGVSPVEHSMGVRLTSDAITDFSNVTLKKCGKNLIDYKNDFETVAMSGNNRYAIDIQQHIPADNVVTLSYGIKDMNSIPEYFYFYSDDPDITEKNNNSTTIYLTTVDKITQQKLTFKIRDGYIYRMYYRNNNTTVSAFQNWLNKFEYMQVEVGESATDYEPYIEPITHAVNADGTVDDVVPFCPTTTLLTDTEDVQINCEYNKDLNKVIAELQQAIISLGGNV